MSRFTDNALFFGGFAAGGYLGYTQFNGVMQKILLGLSSADFARNFVQHSRFVQPIVSRFVAGQEMEDALAVAKTLNAAGMMVSMDYLGESVKYPDEAIAARNHICTMLGKIANERVNANVSVKLTQLGLKLNSDLAFDNMREILTQAQAADNWVRIDMEESAVTAQTIAVYGRLRDAGFDNVGIVVQAYLYRTADDVAGLIQRGARVRLCKGAYDEPIEVAFGKKAQTDANYVRLARELLGEEARANGVYPAFATHDDKMVQAVINYTREHEIATDQFEFQMLYGVRTELQNHLRDLGYRVRIYVPYGEAWYPYLMRRMAEKPANLQLVLANL
jgi:proline dehydrogenase